MASLESEKGKPTGLADYKRDLRNIEEYAGKAGARQAQIVYLKGLMRGLVGARRPRAAARAGALRVRRATASHPAVLAGCLVAGSFGATMSVLMRMSAASSTSTTRSGAST